MCRGSEIKKVFKSSFRLCCCPPIVDLLILEYVSRVLMMMGVGAGVGVVYMSTYCWYRTLPSTCGLQFQVSR
jgi:hypothetical protein